jgi:uncharacterized protein YkwD
LWLALLGGCELPLDEPQTFFCSSDGTCGGASDCYSRCYCDSEDTIGCEAQCGTRGVRVQDLDESMWTSDWVALEDEVITLVNDARAMGGCCDNEGCFGASEPLSLDTNLRRSARAHAFDMADQGYFDHDSNDGRDAFDRMREAGFRGCALGENIAAGQASAVEVVESWLDSPGHCANILNPQFDEIGVGYTEANDRYGNRWVQNFGG